MSAGVRILGASLVAIGLFAVAGRLSCGEVAPGGSLRPAERTASDEPAEAAGSRAGPGTTARLPESRGGLASPAARSASGLRVQVSSRSTGEPLDGVRVSVELAGTAQPTWTAVRGSRGGIGRAPSTGRDGRTELAAPAGKALVVTAWLDRLRALGSVEVAALSAGEVRSVRLAVELPEPPRFFGLVVADESGEPLPGASIGFVAGKARLEDLGAARLDDLSIGSAARTDVLGRFELPLTSSTSQVAFAVAEGRAPRLFALSDARTRPEDALVVRLARGATLRVDVTGPGAPGCVGATVRARVGCDLIEDWLLADFLVTPEELIRDAAVDAHLSADLGALPPGLPVQLELRRNQDVLHRAPRTLELAPGEARVVELVLGAGARIRGRVADQHDASVARHELLLVRPDFPGRRYLERYDEVQARTTTDEDGRYAFEDVPAGDWLLGPAPTRGGGRGRPELVAPVGEPVTVPEGSPELERDLAVTRGLYIRGRVLECNGGPARDIFVTAYGAEVQGGVTHQSRPDGSFSIGPLSPGRYELDASGVSSDCADSERVSALAGDEDVRLELRAGASLRGRVVDAATGRGLAADVEFWTDEHPELPTVWLMTSTASRSDGNFELGGLPPGGYTLLARSLRGDAGLVESVRLGAGEARSELTVTVARAARLRLAYGGEAEHATLRVQRGGATLGYEVFVGRGRRDSTFPPGEYAVQLLDAALEVELERSVTLVAGETTLLSLP